MKVIACDRSAQLAPAHVHIEGFGSVTVNVPKVELDELLASSDFISLHVPKQPNGNAVIAEEQFQKLKKGVVLINTSRGGVIDETLLPQYLDNGTVSAACLDVFVGEPSPNPLLLQHPKIIATPHIGAATLEAQERIGLEIAEKVKEIMSVK
jgi:D-3-phosphoglycerate dehydrogenase / 2-oxoglutarate reductase